MHNSQDLQNVLSLRQTLIEGDETRLKQQRSAGKMTARERIATLVDEGSFVELFALMRTGDDGAGVITGYGTIKDRPVYVAAQDFTVHGGAMGQAQSRKLVKMLDMAKTTGAPIVFLCDSAGVRLDEGAQAMGAYAEVYQKMARLSGVCPILSVVLGPCVGGAALISQLSDLCVMAGDVGELMMFGPQVLAAMNGSTKTAKELGGAEFMMAQGGIAYAAKNEAEALQMADKLLTLLPSSNAESAPIEEGDDLNRLLPSLDPAQSETIATSILDMGSAIELYAGYEPCIRTYIGRLGGRTAALVATDPTKNDGLLTAKAMMKAARFVRFMDCYSIPVVSLVNTKGVAVTDVNEQVALMKAQSQLLYAYAEATTAKLCVVTGDAIGQSYIAMGGLANADVSYAWPTATLSALTPEAAVAVLYRDKVLEDKELSVEQARAKYADEYVSEVASALCAAKQGMIDDIIEPAQTRMLLIAAVEMLLSKRDSNPPKKHGNLPL